MALSTLELHLLAVELKRTLCGGVLRHIAANANRALCVELRQPGHNHWLLLSLDPQTTRAHLVDARVTPLPTPTAFVMLLRKHLEGMTLLDLRAIDDERILRLDLHRRAPDEPDPDAPPRLTRAALIIELSGRHANALLLDADDRILGLASHDRSTIRPLRAGVVWTPPPRRDLPGAARDRLGLADLPPDGARSAAAAAHYAHLEATRGRDAACTDALRRLRERAQALRRRVQHLEGDLKRASDAERFKRWGELLQSAWGKVPRGAAAATVPDYYDPELPLVDVPLDPALDLSANIERYFKRYRKYHDALDGIEDRLLHQLEALDTLEQRSRQVEALITEVRASLDPAPLSLLKTTLERLEAEGVLPKPRPPQPRQRSGTDEVLPYRAFASRAGKAILVGKGPRQNDQLTLRIARGRDIWLHARDTPGAHVLVRLERNQSLDHETLLDAAQLAAHYSKADPGAVIDVSWTEARHVRKPKGYPPGLVTIAQAHTIAVRLEPARLQRLMHNDA